MQRSHGEPVPGMYIPDGFPQNTDVCASNKIPQIQRDGWSACSRNNKCGVGKGDCDNSDECKRGLVCYDRGFNDPVPGVFVSGVESSDSSDDDYDICAEPSIIAKSKGGDYCKDKDGYRCSIGLGDCDNDNQCEGDLLCFERTHDEAIPGIYTGRLTRDDDICFLPDFYPKVEFENVGCSRGKPCGAGQGQCNSDSDCKTGHKCNKPSNYRR